MPKKSQKERIAERFKQIQVEKKEEDISRFDQRRDFYHEAQQESEE